MKNNSFLEIKTERLFLRKLKQSDWKMVCHLRSDKNINEFIKRPSAKSKEEALEFISKANTAIDNKSMYYWAITEKNNTEIIGTVCLWNFSKDKRIAEIGGDLSLNFQKLGIAKEGLESVLEFGFKNLNLDFINASVHKKNKNAIKLLEKNGLTLVKGKKDKNNPGNVVYQKGK